MQTASEADPDLGFMGRMMVLCSLPRTNPGNQIQYKPPPIPNVHIVLIRPEHSDGRWPP